ncbi:MAG: rhomboid family intramembrane serine protease [Candidatus Hydrogenedentota bacterium]|nr:MAG: rhomboid family intramembrane serine protease [Candidatus Hydrogenedentota bacterium]
MIPIADSIPHRRPPVMLYLIIIINVAVFFFEIHLPSSLQKAFFLNYGFVSARWTLAVQIFHIPWLTWATTTIFTSMFMHGGWVHLLGNMWMLWIFGDNVEDRMGPFGFLTFYLFCGTIAALTQAYFYPTAHIPTVGASGAISGVLGAYFMLYPFSRVVTLIPLFIWPLFIELPAVLFIGIWAWLQFYSGTLDLAFPGLVGNVAWWAHVGGFAAGLISYRWFVSRRNLRSPYIDEWGPSGSFVKHRNPWRCLL